MADQVLFSLANFVFNILLARWLDPAGYGAFAAGYALLWLGWAFYKGLLLDPAMVFSSNRFRDALVPYHSSLLLGHALLSLGLAAIFALTGAAAQMLAPQGSAVPWFCLAVTGPLILLPALLRGLCRARLKTALGALAAAVYLVCVLVGALLLRRLQLASAALGFIVLAGASAAGALLVIGRLGLSLRSPALHRGGLLGRIVAEHWRYGRWLLGADLLSWIPANIWYAALPLLAGTQQAGVLRALSNLSQPAVQGYGVAHSLLIPMFVEAEANGRFHSTLNLMLAAMLAVSLAFGLVVALFAGPLLGWLYGGRYTEDAFLVWPLMLRTVLMGVAVVQSAAMQALERGDWLLASFVATAVFVVIAGLPATAIWGVSGAVYGQLLAELTVVLGQLWWLSSYSKGAAGITGPDRGFGSPDIGRLD